MSSQSQWDITLRSAKSLETRLEATIQKYSAIAQRLSADYLCDEENGLLESKEEQELSSIIENDLKKLADSIDMMRTIRNAGASKGVQNQESIIKRFFDVHQEYCREYKNTYNSVKQKRDHAELLQSASANGREGRGDDSLISKLLREKTGLVSSMRSINDVISQAFETKNSLLSQRGSLQGSAGGISSLVANVPSFQRLIEGVQRKKTRETMLVSLFVGVLLCFTIWWIFLR